LPGDSDWRGLASRLQRYYAGQPVTFEDLPLDLDGMTSFSRSVMLAVRAIPHGQVRSYGQVAASVGRPGAARAVGAVMARNPVCVVVPCHRVVGSDGALTGFGGGLPLKRRMLELEGSRAK
jgi:methylated-DNA-[protein]-cysteine S-methyltransferase